MADLKCSNLGFAYGDAAILQDINITIASGSMMAVVGPNGAGKSTLLKCLAGLLNPTSGSVTLDERSVSNIPPKELAAKMAMVPAEAPAIRHMTVAQCVALGRTPYVGVLGSFGQSDHQAVKDALKALRLEAFHDRRLLTLSSGEMQRVMLAQALCQQPKVLLLDEPTAHLDLYNNMELLNFLSELNRRDKVSVVAVLHDLAAAAAFFPLVTVLSKGRVAVSGETRTALCPEVIGEAFGVDAQLETSDRDITWRLPLRH